MGAGRGGIGWIVGAWLAVGAWGGPRAWATSTPPEAPSDAKPMPPEPPSDSKAAPGGLSDDTTADGPGTARIPVRPDRGVSLIYTGAGDGLGAAVVSYDLVPRLRRALLASGWSLQSARPTAGLLTRGEDVVWSPDGTLGTVTSSLGAGPVRCDPPQTVTVQQATTAWVMVPPEAPRLSVADGARAVQRDLHDCTAADGSVLHWLATPGSPWPGERVTTYDVRRGVFLDARDPGGTGRTLPLVTRPRQEAPRRLEAIRRARAEDPDALYLDAGGFVDGASAVDPGRPSRHRAHGFSLLASLAPDALVPGPEELAFGADDLLQTAEALGLPYVATNWRAEDPDHLLPTVLWRTVPHPDGPVRVAILGVVDPAVARAVPALADQGVTLVDPVAAVNAATDTLAADPQPPDVVVLLGEVSPALQDALRRRLHGVDLFLGDPSAATYRVREASVALRRVTRVDETAPKTLPLDGLARVRVQVAAGRPSDLRLETLPVTASSPSDPSVTEAITAVRTAVYPPYEDPVVPGPADDPWAGVSAATWERLVCEAVLEVTQADVAYLAALPPPPDRPGPLLALDVADALATLDQLEVVTLDGDRMGDVLNTTHDVVPVHCGAPTAQRFPRARGFYLEPERTYRAVTTDRTRRTTPLGDLLDQGSADLVGHLPKARPVVDDEGVPWTLQRAVLSTLRRWRDEGADGVQGPGWVGAVAERGPGQRRPEWLLRMRRVGLRVERFAAAPTDAYAQVPETLLNNPSSFTLGADLDSSLEYSDADVTWSLGLGAAYTRLAVADAEPQETADDWRVSTALRVPRARLPGTGDLELVPFGEVLFDSEFTPLQAEDGAIPRQADLTATLGLSVWRWRWLRSMSVGPFVNRDLGRLDDKTFEWGGRLTAETRHDVPPASALRLSTLWDLSVFGDTPLDDEADLRLRLWAEGRMSVRVLRWLDLSGFVQTLVVQGRVPSTRKVAASVTAGASLDLSAAFVLARRGRRAR